VLDKVTTGQKKALDLFMEQSKRQVELATKAKGFDEFIKGQAELAKETSERMLEETKTNMQVANEMREKYSAMVKDQIAKFTDKVRSFTPGMGS